MMWRHCGPIEYGIAGNGPPVLAIHGAGITGPEFMMWGDGGHFLLGHYDEIKARIMAFLAEAGG